MLEERSMRRIRRKRIRRKRIRRERQLRRRMAILAAAAFLILATAAIRESFIVKAQDTHSAVTYKYYTSIRIGEGDSLWSIAADYAEGFDSPEDFIREVIHTNHLLDSDIRAGDYLIIPYYSAELMQ
ncbi:MAG TPA: LysM peptidoglycan-binding domain-containing protein [Candidatus Eisenbergiella merdipullorum]|uniref:LysM peptidoglycan-binding domain-containing protein n=1 Tax=Candidatus Eisenbergiella merdipullorum TaxID=2838553 RepID=A0A9D2I6I7_9FIRM|nr:LysM peptidoglycan-binding domain-containing protein [Candidatus Eisenbergiella merdipullorum]